MTKIAFFEVEDWEKKYLQKRLDPKQKFDLQFFDEPLGKKNLSTIKDVEILGVFIYSELDKAILSAFDNLQLIATMSTGYDHIDLNTCRSKKIKVANVPSYGENTVAEHTFALILALSRKLIESVDRTRRGDFNLENLRGFDLKGKTIGIIGFGHIGAQVTRMAQGFSMKILAYDPKPDKKVAKDYQVKFTTLDELLSQSDIISLHAPLTKTTKHLINKKNINKIKNGAILINTARGGLIQTEALALALEKQILAGVGLDVLEEEVFIKEEKELLTLPFKQKQDLRTILENHILLNDRRVIITPHNAFNSHEALTRILDTTIENILAFNQGKAINLVK